MKYDFTTVMNRAGMDAIAVDGPPKAFGTGAPKEGWDVIPMWVADMNFPTVPTIQEAIIERVKEPHFGYLQLRDEYFEKIIRWHRERNGVEGLTRDCIGYENGVLGGVSSAAAVNAVPGDRILVHSPTYIGFTNGLTNAGYRLVQSPLVLDENGVWRMDFEDMDRKLKENKIHVAVFCSPHNPCGRVWERWEIEKAMEIYKANDCLVISDEIWSDLVLEGHKHIPTQSISEDARQRTIALYAPSKTFNLAGLVGSYHVIYNEMLRDRHRSNASKTHYNNVNVLSMYALMGAYTDEGMQWVDELCQVLTENTTYAWQYIHDHFPGVQVAKPEGTYMLFLDCEGWCREKGVTMDQVLTAAWDVGVSWQDGRDFGGAYTVRMNVALPRSRVEEAMERLRKYVFV